MTIAATAILPSVAATNNYEKWGSDSEGKEPDNRFVVGNWKKTNEGWRGIKSPLALFQKRSNLPAFKIVGENSTVPGGKKANEIKEKWGESAGERINNRFEIERLMRNNITNQDKTEDGIVEEQMLELSFHRMSTGWLYTLTGSPASSILDLVCGNSSDAHRGCMVTHTKMAKKANGNYTCKCYVTPNPNVSNEDCCRYVCCNNIQHIPIVLCGNSSHPYDCEDTGIFVQDPAVIVTESMTGNSLDKTTVANGGSTPTRGDHGLAAVAAAILIFIHICRQEHFL